MLDIQTNEFQTPITAELLNMYPQEVIDQFEEFVTTIPFIKWLISPDRPRAKDLPRDDKGRIIVDLEHPHIIEDADYFRQPALHFMTHGCYTFLRPNSNPHSEYHKFWEEERHRCREGYVRESDGEWVTGFCYWFLNYNPMMVNKIDGERKKATRIESFPYFFEGIYWRFHYLWQARDQGKHAIELAKRGCGKSYSLSAIMTHNLELGEDEEQKTRRVTVLTAYQKEYLKDDKDGTLNKFVPSLSFVQSNTPFPRLMLKQSPNEMSWQMGYKDEFGRPKGSFNQVLGVSAKDDADKLRGKRGWILFEEMGTFAGLLGLYDVTRKSVEEGDYTFACMYLIGTANNAESDFSSAKKLLQAPDGYNILSLQNVFDKPSQGSKRFGFFFPAYINRLGCYNHNGVSDVVKALLQILMARYKAKYNNADPQSILRVIAEDPITPAEAIVKVKAAYFPITDLNTRLEQLDNNPKEYSDVWVGELVNKNGTIEFTPTADQPIRQYGVANDTPGAIEIFNMPERKSNGTVYEGRYIIGHDPVDNDAAESSSLSSTFVFDLWTDQIVAEFTGRRPLADDNFEIVRKLCLFYNAKCLYESNKKGLFSYFKNKSCTYLLADTPQYLRDRQLIKYSAVGSGAKGVNASASINNYANDLIRQWLLKLRPIILKDEKGEEYESSQETLYTIRNRALLEELIAFNPEINVDRIRSLGMVMLYRQQFMGDEETRKDEDKVESDYLGNDDYFTRNFDRNGVTSKFSKKTWS